MRRQPMIFGQFAQRSAVKCVELSNSHCLLNKSRSGLGVLHKTKGFSSQSGLHVVHSGYFA